MRIISIVIFSIIFIEISTLGQNLIKNPEFDDYYTYIDSNKNLVYHPEFWYYNSITSDHPIYFSSDRFLNKSLTWNPHPDSVLIRQGLKVNYISILILPNPQKAYTAFKEPLKKDKKYHLSIDIKAFELSNCLSDLLVGFKDCLNCNMDSSLYQLKLIIPDSLCNEFLLHNWLTLNADFTALGNEKVLVVSAGSSYDYLKIIYSNQDKFTIRYYSGPPNLKYYIDNICLTAIESKSDSSFTNRIDALSIGESIILQNIYFDFDKYVILKESFPVLDKVADFLAKKRNVRIQISGHTDNIGSNEYNDELSDKRAISVVDYLVNKGIAKNRLQSAGFGSRFPVDSNDTDEGRQKNRRIEMKIIAK
jgi:outer membrane protein OmpA-like peptidoglycan-associated protein